MHIILYSDSAEVQAAVATQLGAAPDRLSVCNSGMELLAAVRTVAADAVILDLGTHGLSASLLGAALRELAPGLPTVAVSATAVSDAKTVVQQGVPHVVLSAGGDGELRTLLHQLSGQRRGYLAVGSEQS